MKTTFGFSKDFFISQVVRSIILDNMKNKSFD